MTTAAEIQQAQLTFAQNALTGANGFISDLQTLSRLPEIVIDGLPVPDYANSGIAADPLSTRDFLLQFRPLNFLPIVPQSNVPVPPTFDIAIPDDVVVPSFDASAPVLEIPPVPSNALPTAPNAPDTTEPTIPAAPTITLPSPPMVGSIVLPTPPTIITPQFAGVLAAVVPATAGSLKVITQA